MEYNFEVGDRLHLRLNIEPDPIVHKYREGKLKRTLGRELKEVETTVEKRFAFADVSQDTAACPCCVITTIVTLLIRQA